MAEKNELIKRAEILGALKCGIPARRISECLEVNIKTVYKVKENGIQRKKRKY